MKKKEVVKMALETKVVNSNWTNLTDQSVVDLYSCFGWQTLGVTDNRITFNRDVNMNNYVEIKNLESEFEKHKQNAQEYYNKMQINRKHLILLFLFAIFPMVIYLVLKSKAKKNYQKEKKLMYETASKAKNLFYETN